MEKDDDSSLQQKQQEGASDSGGSKMCDIIAVLGWVEKWGRLNVIGHLIQRFIRRERNGDDAEARWANMGAIIAPQGV